MSSAQSSQKKLHTFLKHYFKKICAKSPQISINNSFFSLKKNIAKKNLHSKNFWSAISTDCHFFQVYSKHAFITLKYHTFSAYLGSCLPVVLDTDPAEEIVPSLYGCAAECSVHIVFLGEWCFNTGLAVVSVLFCKAVCQEDETHELDIWLVNNVPYFIEVFTLHSLHFQYRWFPFTFISPCAPRESLLTLGNSLGNFFQTTTADFPLSIPDKWGTAVQTGAATPSCNQ